MQIVFQDPYSSLNPRMTVGEILASRSSSTGCTPRPNASRVGDLLDVVGLRPEQARRFPHEFPAASASGSASPARWRSIPT